MHPRLRRIKLFHLMFILGAVSVAGAPGFDRAYGQDASNSQAPAAQEIKIPGLSELVPQASVLEEALTSLDAELTDTEYLRGLDKDLQTLGERGIALRSRYEEIKASNNYGFDQIMEVRGTARDISANLGGILASTTERLNRLGAYKQKWQQDQSQWGSWKKALIKEKSVQNIFAGAEAAINKALRMITTGEGPLIELQKKITVAQTDVQAIVRDSDALIKNLRMDIYRKSGPSILSPTFASQFNDSLFVEFRQGIRSLSLPPWEFFSLHGWVIFLQLLLVLAIYLGLVSARKRELVEKGWQYVFMHPLSTGIFVAVLGLYPLYGEMPALWRLILFLALIVSGVQLAAKAIGHVWRRRLIYLLAAHYLISQFFILSGFPTPLFRLYITAVSLAGAALCYWRIYENRSAKVPTPYAVALWTGGSLLAIVFFAQLGGYAGFASHLLDATVKTVFLCIFGWMTSQLVKGGMQALLTNDFSMRNTFMRRRSGVILRRTDRVIDVAIIFFTGCGILAVWGIYDTAGNAASGILAFSLTAKGHTISLGLLVTASMLFFGTLSISWLVQQILSEEVYPRRNVQGGVGHSINRIIQYMFVLFGTLIALSALGIQLQNLAVIVGALGIGIGFGLQNIVNNLVSGIILLFERPIKVGDIVQINGEWGQVKNLGLRATVVETFDRSELIVPNSDFISTTITNWTFSNRQTRIIIPVGIAYGSDVPRAMTILGEIAGSHKEVLTNPQPVISFKAFAASSLDFELRVWIGNLDNRLSVTSDLLLEIDRRFRMDNIEIAFPQQDLHIRSVDESVKKALMDLLKKENDKKPQSD